MNLPEYDPHPDLWNRIEADLDSDDRLAHAVSDLPLLEPKDDLWERIDADLASTGQVRMHPVTEQKRQSPFTIIRPLWAGAAAAAMVVLVGAWLLWQPKNDAAERIEYAVETDADWSDGAAMPETNADQRAEDFIARQCAEQTLACQRPEVHELRNQLQELTAEQQRLDQERQTFGDDPALVRAQVKVENQRAEVTKELITLLRS